MAHAPKPELVRTELKATLDRFEHYLTGTRYDRKRKLRASTAARYVVVMHAVLEWAGTLSPTVEQLQAYQTGLSNGQKTAWGTDPSDSTKRSTFYGMKAWLEWRRTPLTEAQEKEFLVPPTPKMVREMPLDMERIHELLARCPTRRHYAIVRVLLATGIRRAELAALKVKHLDFAARKLWVPEIGEDGRAAAKGGNGGWVCISQIALEACREHLASRCLGTADPEAPLFESLNGGGHLTPHGVTVLVRNLTERILGFRVCPHQMRHAFASHAAAGGEGRPPMPLVALQKQMRHKSKETTLRYLHGTENLQDAYERSAPVF